MKHYCNRQTPKKNVTRDTDTQLTEASQNGGCTCTDNTNSHTDGDKDKDEVIFPPGSSYEFLEGSGVEIRTYGEETLDEDTAAGGAVSQRNMYRKQLETELMKYGAPSRPSPPQGNSNNPISDNMSGKFNIMSVPKAQPQGQIMTMPMYLNNYLGKYICLDLWTTESRRIEKCGILTDIGLDFIAVKNPSSGEHTLIDLRTIRYVSIYCV